MSARFLNADLEITSHQSLDALVHCVADRACNLYCGTFEADLYLATFEIPAGETDRDPELLIHRLCDLWSAFTPAVHMLVKDAKRRVIDLGYETDSDQEPMKLELSAATLSRLATLEVGLAFTLYCQE
ncbi:MAG: hypothetical protein J0L73_12565 [Verrucomicrobia bacterium]|nr:hypothetical protein [Verrucomicrobiota bacterium]